MFLEIVEPEIVDVGGTDRFRVRIREENMADNGRLWLNLTFVSQASAKKFVDDLSKAVDRGIVPWGEKKAT